MSREKVKYSLSNWELVSVNPNNKTWNAMDLFCFWAVNIQSVVAFSLIASLYIIYDLNTFIVFFGTLVGSIFVYFFANLIGYPSQKHGVPFPVLLRLSLGIKASKYFAFTKSLVGIFLFGVQTYFLSKAFTYLIRILIFSFEPLVLEQEIFLLFILGLNIIDWTSIIIAILFQCFLFGIGMNFNKKIIRYSAIIVYLGLLFFFLTILFKDFKSTLNAFLEIFDHKNFFINSNIEPLILISGTIFAYFSSLLVSFGDFSRYVQNKAELKKGNFTLLINLIIFSFISVFIVIGSDVLLNLKFLDLKSILTSPNDIIGKFDNISITIIALFFILVSSISSNLLSNFISSQYSLINFFPNKLNFRNSTYVIGLFGFIVAIFWLSELSQKGALSFVDTLGSFFGPLFGVIIIDYFLIKNKEVSNKDIFLLNDKSIYYYTGGWHIKGVYAVFIGFIFSSATIWNFNLMFLQSFAWLIGAFASSLIYYLLAKK